MRPLLHYHNDRSPSAPAPVPVEAVSLATKHYPTGRRHVVFDAHSVRGDVRVESFDLVFAAKVEVKSHRHCQPRNPRLTVYR
jgi:hypothetical protein